MRDARRRGLGDDQYASAKVDTGSLTNRDGCRISNDGGCVGRNGEKPRKGKLMIQRIKNLLAGWLLGIRITGPELRALADKIAPLSPSQQWAQGYDTGRTRGLLEGRGIGGGAPSCTF